MQNQVIPNGSKVDTKYGVFEVLNYSLAAEQYFCYKKGFDGHGGIGHFGRKYLNTKYGSNCWWFSADEVSLIEESKVSNLVKQPKFKAGDKVRCVKENGAIGVYVGKTYTVKNSNVYGEAIDGNFHVSLEEVKSSPSEHVFELVEENKDYRKMKPTDLIKISIDGNESEVPLGDLVSLQALIGKSTGEYSKVFYNFLFESLGCVDLLNVAGNVIYFNGQQEQAINCFFKPHYDEKEKKELEAQIAAKSNELFELQAKLKDLQN